MTDWSRIVQQHGPVVWQTACRLLNNEADASDCFQRTFISALELQRTETVRNWPALLRRLTVARALDCLRQRHREALRRCDFAEEAAIDGKAARPDEAAQASELTARLREALADLDRQQAQVFCLVCLENWSYQQVADELGLTTNHVGVLLHRARTALQERLQGYVRTERTGERGALAP